MSKISVTVHPVFGNTRYHAFIGYDEELGGILVHHDDTAIVFSGMDRDDVNGLRAIADEEGGQEFEDYFTEVWGDSMFGAVEGRTLVSLSGAKRVDFPLTQDTPEEMIKYSLAPHITIAEDDDGVNREWVRNDDKKFRADHAAWILPRNTSDAFLARLREIMRNEGVPAQMARRRADGKQRTVSIGEPSSITYVLEEPALEEEPEIEIHDMGSALGEQSDPEPQDTTQKKVMGGLDLDAMMAGDPQPQPAPKQKAKPKPKRKVSLGDKPNQPPKVSTTELPPKAQEAVESGMTHGLWGRVASTDEQAIFEALVNLHLEFSKRLNIELAVMLPRRIGDEQFPPHIVKKLINAGVNVSDRTPTAPGKVGLQLEPS